MRTAAPHADEADIATSQCEDRRPVFPANLADGDPAAFLWIMALRFKNRAVPQRLRCLEGYSVLLTVPLALGSIPFKLQAGRILRAT